MTETTPSRRAPVTRVAAAPAGDPANSMRPDVAPTPAQTRAAQSLDTAPAAAPVPYTDFLPPPRATGKAAMMHHGHVAVHHAVLRHTVPKSATPAAASAPATPAPAATPAAPAK